MNEPSFRIESDSMGEVRIPADRLWGAQTQRAVINFPISGIRIPAPLIHALGHIKHACAQANIQLGESGFELLPVHLHLIPHSALICHPPLL